MLSSTELPTVATIASRNGTSDNKHSATQNAYASSSKSVLPMHSLIDTAPSPLPLVYQANAETSRETPEDVPTGAAVPRGREIQPDHIAGPSPTALTLPTVPADGRTLCVRHQMMADQDVNGKLQKVSYILESDFLKESDLTPRYLNSRWMPSPSRSELPLPTSGPRSAHLHISSGRLFLKVS